MLQVTSDQPLEALESALRRAAQHYDASVILATRVGQHLPESSPGRDALTVCVCHPELYSALLEGDIRLSAFLPCRIAAYVEGGRVTLVSVSPVEFCRLLNRADLAPLAAPLEAALLDIMREAARPVGSAAHAAAGPHRGGLGATEEQVNLRGSLPQRIDCHGTKIEDLGGTGEQDAKGG